MLGGLAYPIAQEASHYSAALCALDIAEPPTGDDLIVDWSAVSPMKDDPCQGNYKSAPEIAAISAEFNAAWTGLLDGLSIAFNEDKSALRDLVPRMYTIK